MSDDESMLLRKRLEVILAALQRIPRRFTDITEPRDFISSEEGFDRLDSICMILIAAGEEFKKIDRQTKGELFNQYPQVPWRGAIGLRDVLAHAYFQADPEQIYVICRDRVPVLIETVQQIIQDLESSTGSK